MGMKSSDQDSTIAIRDFTYDGTEESPAKKRKIEPIFESLDDMAAPEQFEGFMIHDSKNWTKFTKEKVYPSTAARLKAY